MRALSRRTLATLGVAALAIAGLTATSASAHGAVPVTTTASAPSGDISINVSDTVLDPGFPVTDLETSFTNTTGSEISSSLVIVAPPAVNFTLTGCGTTGLPPTCSQAGNEVTLEVSIPAGESGTISVGLYVFPTTPDGTYPMTLTGAVDGTAVTFSPAVSLTVGPPPADLEVALDATAGPLLGSQITYDLDVSNAGPGDATASSVEIDLPHKVYSVSNLPAACAYDSSTDVVTCDTGAITNGDTSSLSFKANIALLSIGSLNATATRVTSSPDDPNPANDTSTAHCGSLTGLIITC
ncbi:hypothetical protein [Isoptericola aurantiacus]|uniref:hypothetical protein n=1 Tax=Isoptericola aurantiacus TaxID=3377839 RepID=UPI00383BC6AF